MKVLKNMTMGVLVLATASCASSAPPLQPPAVNVTGDWVGTWSCDFMSQGNGVVVLGLTQNGNMVTGPLLVTNSTFNRVSKIAEGVVSGDKVLTQSNDLSGTFTVTGDSMSGPFTCSVASPDRHSSRAADLLPERACRDGLVRPDGSSKGFTC